MGLQAIDERPSHAPLVRSLYQVTEIIPAASGTTGAVRVSGVTVGAGVGVIGLEWVSNATVGVSLGGVYYVGASEYDPAFVERVLRADAAPSEASFDNVVDLMDWLERD